MNESVGTKNPYQYKLKNIEIHEVSLTKNAKSSEQLFHFTIKIENKINQKEKLIFVECQVDVFGHDKVTTLGKITCLCIFELADFDSIINTNSTTGKSEIPIDLSIILNQITIGTTRGVMYSAFKGTAIHFAFLPIVDVKEFQPQG